MLPGALDIGESDRDLANPFYPSLGHRLGVASASSRARDAQPAFGVLTLHGVGSHEEGSDFDATLRGKLQKLAGQQVKIVVKAVYYHGESRDREAKLWQEYDRLESGNPRALDQTIIRKVMLATLSDALAYADHGMEKDSFYRVAHEKVREAVAGLEAELGGSSPLAVVAHSLGCKLIFDYLCDAQSGQGVWKGEPPPNHFQQLGTLRLLITTGCNLPLFESATPPTERRFFRVSQGFQWINFYDRDDLLGWPLRPLGGRFAELVQDQERNHIGSMLTSHGKYWRDEDLNEEIAAKILELVRTDAAAKSGP